MKKKKWWGLDSVPDGGRQLTCSPSLLPKSPLKSTRRETMGEAAYRADI